MHQPTSITMPLRPDHALLRWIKAHPILTMTLLLYLLAWPRLITSATDSYGLTSLNLPGWLDIPTGWAPAIAAFTVTALVQGRAGMRELLRKTLRWRVGLVWYAVALLGSAFIILLEGGAYDLFTGNGAALPVTQMPALQAATMPLVMLLLYMLVNTEEIAWRGFALPRLQSRYGALGATLLVWVPWTLFHLPYFFTKDSLFQQMGLPVFASGTLALSILLTWLFNNTKGSVFICTLMHAALNTWPMLLIPAQTTMPSYLNYVTDALIALVLILVFGATHLARKPDNASVTY